MRVHLRSLNPETTVVIKGDEPWLRTLYADFEAPERGGGGDEPAARLTGTLRLRKEQGDSVHVTGRVTFAPTVPCSRCEKLLAWPLDVEIDARFLPPTGEPLPRDKTLKAQDVDVYHLEYQEVDLEGLVNDFVQMSLPTRYVQESEDGTSCVPCGADLTQDHLWTSQRSDEGRRKDQAKAAGEAAKSAAKAKEDAAESPFAVLKGLKLRH
jgi:uncharacterized metal-binding protein YceD (DUF177 family)